MNRASSSASISRRVRRKGERKYCIETRERPKHLISNVLELPARPLALLIFTSGGAENKNCNIGNCNKCYWFRHYLKFSFVWRNLWDCGVGRKVY